MMDKEEREKQTALIRRMAEAKRLGKEVGDFCLSSDELLCVMWVAMREHFNKAGA